jgi:ABC-2 type transport system ATP-binding protein
VHQPDVLFLDEPTAGLDPQTRVNLWDILMVLHAQGQTILLTTHYMEEAESLCDRIAVVDHGKILAEGSVDKLLADSGAQTIVTVRYEERVPDELARLADLAERPGVTKVEADGDLLRVFSTDPEGLLGDLISLGAASGLHVRDASTAKPSLETAFLALTGREYRE